MNYQMSRWKLVLPLFRQPFLGHSRIRTRVDRAPAIRYNARQPD